MPSSIQKELQKLAVTISACRVCDSHGIPVRHSTPMQRGFGKLGIVVGIQPGKTEIQSATAFSGLAGRRLMDWLAQAEIGRHRDEIFECLYFTSLAKCFTEQRCFAKAFHNCRPFLIKQIDVVRPRILITLGIEPLAYLFGLASLEDWVGTPFTENDVRPNLFPLLPPQCIVIALPHPSPLSRWLNDTANQDKLQRALKKLGRLAREYNNVA